jgi:hypothetical protein
VSRVLKQVRRIKDGLPHLRFPRSDGAPFPSEVSSNFVRMRRLSLNTVRLGQ